jgi:hypothetical protein
VGHDVAVDQGGKIWHADERQRGFYIAAQHRSFMHFRPGLHLPFDLKGIDIDPAGGVTPVPAPVEFERANAALADVANKACLLKGFLGCNLVGGEAPDGIALGNDPSSAASGSHKADINIPIWGDKEWKCSNLVQGIIPILETQNLLSVDSSA